MFNWFDMVWKRCFDFAKVWGLLIVLWSRFDSVRAICARFASVSEGRVIPGFSTELSDSHKRAFWPLQAVLKGFQVCPRSPLFPLSHFHFRQQTKNHLSQLSWLELRQVSLPGRAVSVLPVSLTSNNKTSLSYWHCLHCRSAVFILFAELSLY